jgi:hypothetical protein
MVYGVATRDNTNLVVVVPMIAQFKRWSKVSHFGDYIG